MYWNRRARAGRRDRGAVAVEAAFFTPVFVLLLFGMLEFGLLFKDWMSVTSAVRVAARTASSMPRNALYVQATADQLTAATTALDRSQIQAAWVYDANANGYPDSATGWPTTCTKCAKFVWSATGGPGGTGAFVLSGTNGWLATAQNACPADPLHDSVGIYLQLNHPGLTGMIFPNYTIRERAIMSLEPIPSTATCK